MRYCFSDTDRVDCVENPNISKILGLSAAIQALDVLTDLMSL